MVGDRCGEGSERTFEELAAVDLAGGDLEGDDMALEEQEVSIFLRYEGMPFEGACWRAGGVEWKADVPAPRSAA